MRRNRARWLEERIPTRRQDGRLTHCIGTSVEYEADGGKRLTNSEGQKDSGQSCGSDLRSGEE